MNIRRASPGDLDALLRLYVQLSQANATTTGEQARPALDALLSLPHTSLLVGEQDGKVLATVTLVIIPNLTHNARPWAQVENMVVDESMRGTGAGRQLIDECLRLARKAGCYKVQLQSAEGREGAHRFYERLGFTDSSAGFRYYLG